jgi:hypothetical protein
MLMLPAAKHMAHNRRQSDPGKRNMDLLTFFIIAAAVIVIPGPNVLVIISTTIDQGIIRGLRRSPWIPATRCSPAS